MDDHTTHESSNEIPYGYCHCGCGQKTPIAKHANKKYGYGKGEPTQFIPGHWLKSQYLLSPEERFWGKIDKRSPNECWEWQAGKSNKGYGRLWVNGDNVNAHVFSYELHNGPIPRGLFVLHKCDNRRCVNPNHLFLGTQQDNIDDMRAKGRESYPGHSGMPGERNGNARFTNEQVKVLREQFLIANCSVMAFARSHNVPENTMRKIIRFQTYRNT